jgi:hypothetical protein
MPQGMLMARWDDRLGVVLEAKYPEDITRGLSDDDLLTIFSTHAMSESAGILSMRIKRFSIVSYYTGIPEDESEDQYFVALILNDQENPNSFEESLTEVGKMVIDAFGKPDFEDFYREAFDRVSKMKEISEEQRYAFIFRDKVRNLCLTKLADGPMTKEGLAKWLSKEVESEVTDIDGLLAPLLKTDLVTELNISKGKKVSLEYVFLLRDVALIRSPHVDLFKAAKSGQMNPELAEKYVKEVEKFFKNYRITAEDSQLISEYISNPDTYDIIKVLREGYMTREEIPTKIERDMPNIDRHLKRLAEDEIILPIKDKKQRVWVLLQSDIQAITFFPEYMVDIIRRRWKEGTIAKEIALKHLELLRAEYISTQAPKFRQKIFNAITDNFEDAESSIRKNDLDKAASHLDVCSSQAYDMGERKLGAELLNAAKLLREDKQKYIEEQWQEDKETILTYFEKIKEDLQEAKEKKPKKQKEIAVKGDKKGPSEKAEELDKGKGKEMQKEESEAKGKFSLSDSVDDIDKKAPKSSKSAKTTPEPAAEQEAEKEDLKSIISELKEKYKKAQKNGDFALAAETVEKLADVYKEKGDIKRSQKLIEKKNELTVMSLQSKQKQLVNEAKEAQKQGEMEKAAELYSECSSIASDLFKAGKTEQADWVKKFKTLANECREKS